MPRSYGPTVGSIVVATLLTVCFYFLKKIGENKDKAKQSGVVCVCVCVCE